MVKVEPPSGDPLRRRFLDQVIRDDDSPLFRFLCASSKSVVVDPELDSSVLMVREILKTADAVVWSPGNALHWHEDFHASELRASLPGAVVVSVSPFGLEGPWCERAATEFTLQCWSGGPVLRGTEELPPLTVGGESGLWVAGMCAAIGALSRLRSTDATGRGQLVDVSEFECVLWSQLPYPVTDFRMAGKERRDKRFRVLPGIHSTKDSLVGFMVVTGQQWLDFCSMLGRDDWLEDQTLFSAVERWRRADELSAAIEAWTSQRTTSEIIELASLMRIPVAPVARPATIADLDHFVERKSFVANSRGSFLQPNVPYILGDTAESRPAGSAPEVGADADAVLRSLNDRSQRATRSATPFDRLRVLDLTTFWAGPVVGGYLGMAGADVIKVESTARMDGSRYNTVKSLEDDDWWEWTPTVHGANTDKRGIAVDLSSPRGRDVFLQLVARSDVVIENFSPRVMGNLRLEYDDLRAANPGIILLRMPAFGLSGPWCDRSGYAQTIEMSSGLAWMTGYGDGGPELPNGICDPVAGGHATVALLLALAHRDRTGRGMWVEAAMVGSALNIGAEAIVHCSTFGQEPSRLGNRSPFCAPQGIYPAGTRVSSAHDAEELVGISIADDSQWLRLCRVLGDQAWARSPALSTLEGRQERHDEIDAGIAQWCAGRTADSIVEELWSNDIPVAKLIRPHEQIDIAQLQARGFFDELEHPITGRLPYARHPSTSGQAGRARPERRRPPLLGEHNMEVLLEIGLTISDIEALESDGVIGTRPSTVGPATGSIS